MRLDGDCDRAANVDLVRQGNFACFIEGISGQKVISDDFTETGACNFYVTTEKNMATISYAMAFPVRIGKDICIHNSTRKSPQLVTISPTNSDIFQLSLGCYCEQGDMQNISSK